MFYISSFFFFSECQNSWVKSSITLCINQILQNSRTHTNTHIFLAKYFCQHGDIQIYVLCDHESSQKSGSLLKAGNDSHLRRMEQKKKKKRKTETHHNFVKNRIMLVFCALSLGMILLLIQYQSFQSVLCTV